ncbi:MAG: hypothetical protein IAF38_20455 [Bacteroidia bacterium]|nr:hypothetical protein [Bacteroidia bacterium]
MNMPLRKIMMLVPLAAGLVLTSCGGGGDEVTTGTDTLAKVDTMANKVPQVMIGMPDPAEMIDFIRMTSKDGSHSTAFLNPTSNVNGYVDDKSKALNFGIYSCDLDYLGIFDIGNATKEYLKVVKALGEDIGVSAAVSPNILKRAEANVKNPDSLAAIADEIYLSASETLDANGKGPTLALVIAGGYIESLHIAANVMKYNPKNPAVSRFADQKIDIDELILFLKQYESDAGVADAIKQFQDLLVLFNEIKEVPVVANPEDAKKKHFIGGGTVLEMSQEQFTKISEKVKSIRNNFANIK